jgi:peptidylprolyl isomerase
MKNVTTLQGSVCPSSCASSSSTSSSSLSYQFLDSDAEYSIKEEEEVKDGFLANDSINEEIHHRSIATFMSQIQSDLRFPTQKTSKKGETMKHFYTASLMLILPGINAFSLFTSSPSRTWNPCSMFSADSTVSQAAIADDSFTKYSQTNDQELVYLDTVIGSGEIAEKGKVLTVAFKGRLMENGKQFAEDPGLSFRLGTGKVMAGWEQGLEGIRVGGKRTLRIPPSLAFTDKGRSGVIPPGAHLEFDCELISIASNPVEEFLAETNIPKKGQLGIAFFILVLALTPMLPQ